MTDPLSLYCGVHCLQCMADAGNPDCLAAVKPIGQAGAATWEELPARVKVHYKIEVPADLVSWS